MNRDNRHRRAKFPLTHQTPVGKCEIIYTTTWNTFTFIAFLPANKKGRFLRRRRRSRQDSHYARCTGNVMKSVGWLWGVEDPPRFLVDERKGIKGRQKAAFNRRGPTMLGRGSCTLRPSVHVCGSAVYRYRFPLGRDNPLTSVQPSFSPPPLRKGALLLEYCKKTAFSTLEVATRRGLKLITVTTIGTARRGRTPADAPDASCVCVHPPGDVSYAISHRIDDNFGKIEGTAKTLY